MATSAYNAIPTLKEVNEMLDDALKNDWVKLFTGSKAFTSNPIGTIVSSSNIEDGTFYTTGAFLITGTLGPYDILIEIVRNGNLESETVGYYSGIYSIFTTYDGSYLKFSEVIGETRLLNECRFKINTNETGRFYFTVKIRKSR